jgi:hypothetical protein
MRLLAFLLLVSTIGRASGSEGPPLAIDIASFFVEPEVVEIVRNPDSAEIVILSPPNTEYYWKLPPSEYRHSAKKTLSATDSGTISKVLSSDATYRWPDKILPDGRVKRISVGSLPKYNASINFRRGNTLVTIDVSFPVHVVVSKNGVGLNSAFLGENASSLLQLLLTHFPQDPGLIDARDQMRERLSTRQR